MYQVGLGLDSQLVAPGGTNHIGLNQDVGLLLRVIMYQVGLGQE